jgi:copper(I)-binding protein
MHFIIFLLLQHAFSYGAYATTLEQFKKIKSSGEYFAVESIDSETQEEVNVTKDIFIYEIYARPCSKGSNSAGYMRIVNNSSHIITLKSVKLEQELFEYAELHQTYTEQGTDIKKMSPVDKITIPPKKELALMPGSFHIMLMKAKAPVAINDKVRISLEFEEIDPIKVELTIKKQ